MKSLILTLALTVFAVSVSQAQVKRQFRDQSHLKTTVVIKDDQATDIDILNSQFDLADVSMNDVIRITTEQERPKVATAEIAPAIPVIEIVPEAPVSRAVLTIAEVATPKVDEINVPIQQLSTLQVVEQPKAAPAKTTKRAVKSVKKSKSKKYKKKRNKRKRIKLKKRRKVSKRKRFGCYAF